MSITTIPPTFYQIAFATDPNQNALPPYWTDQSWRVQFNWSAERGRQYELDAVETGQWRATLANPDGALDPSNSASPFSPGVVPFRQARVRCLPGPNRLTPDQATAGEASGYPAGITAPPQMAVSNDYGYTVTLAASGSAYQGSQVYQVTLPNAATQFTTILLVKPVPVVPGAAYSFSTQVRINSGTSTPTNAAILWYNTSGTNTASTGGTSVTPTSGSSTWVQVSASGTAPSGAYMAALKVEIASGGSTAASTTWQLDGLQFEQSATPTAFQVPSALSVNLLPQTVATGTASMASTDAATSWFASAAGSVAQATGLAAAPTGSTTAVAWTTAAGTTSSSPFYAGTAATGSSAVDGPAGDCVQVTAGAQYTASVYLMRSSSADATIQVTPAVRWFDATGTVISSSAGSAATVPVGLWVRATVTATAPAGAVWGRPRFAITTPATTTASNAIYSTGWQMEAAASASTWQDPGPTYEIITPLIERWPQSWTEQDGTYGQCDVIGDDAFVALSQFTLAAPFVEEVLAMGPDFFYQLDDPTGSASVTDSASKRPAAPIENSPYGAGSLTLGGSVTSTTSGLAFVGTSGPVATFNNNPSQASAQEPQTFVSLHKTTSRPGPPSGPWTRMIAFRCSSAPASGNFPNLWMVQASSYAYDQSYNALFLNATSGTLSFQQSDANGSGPLWTSSGSVCDGNWHQVIVSYTGGTGYFDIYLDGARVFHDNAGGAGWGTVTNISTDVIGANVVYGRNTYVSGWVGDVAQAIQFPFSLSTTQATTLYNSWRTASSGESTGARIQRILGWIGWSGPTAIDTGQTSSMGPATDLTGATALDAANNVTLTENGNWFTSASGTLTFKSRTSRYGQLAPAVIFGEKTAVGEWPFEAIQLDFDPSHIANNVQVTQYGGSVYTALDAASRTRNFPRVYQRTINSSSASECQDAATYLLGQYKQASLRVSTLRLHVSAVPGLFLVCLQLELGTRIRVNRRPNGAPQITFDGFVEKIEWEWDPQGEVFVNLQCSPADLASYWLLAALRTTLGAQAASGQNQATIRALPDSAVNALASSLPSGYQLTFDPGTSIAETMTIAPGGIPTKNPGYSSALLTFTSNFAFTHQAGAIVCEPLPTGYTDPATWDSVSELGAAYATLSGAHLTGYTNLTVTAFGDAAVNAPASDWSTGDVIWIGVGTPNFEGYNLLHPNISTAGEGVLPLAAGTSGASLGLSSDLGTPTVAASATAWQGANVWQVSVGANAATPSGLLYVLKTTATAGLPFTVSAYVRSITTGANPSVFVYAKFLDANSASLAQTNGTTTALTGSPTASWTRLTASATAPAGTVWVQLGILLTGTSPTSAWTFGVDGLQIEQAASASAYQTAPQIKSGGSAVAGYTTAVITVAQPLVNNHASGEWVCGPLPPGTSDPTTVPGTARCAY